MTVSQQPAALVAHRCGESYIQLIIEGDGGEFPDWYITIPRYQLLFPGIKVPNEETNEFVRIKITAIQTPLSEIGT